MIIFYDKTNGRIVGTIAGRIHSKEHLNMWVGNPKKTNRMVINWKPIKYLKKDGTECKKDHPDVYAAEFVPNHKQKKLFEKLDKNTMKVHDYKVDLKTKKLVLN